MYPINAIDRTAGVFLILIISFLATAGQVIAQEEVDIGIRPRYKKFMPIYGNRNNEPDFKDSYIISHSVYIITGVDTLWRELKEGGGKVLFRKIYLPGDPIEEKNNSNRAVEVQDEKPPRELHVKKTEHGATYWIEEKYFADDEEAENFENEKIHSRLLSGVMAVPFKLRFSYKSSNIVLTGESTIGASIMYKFYRSSAFSNSAGIMAAGGITVINPNYRFLEDEERKPNMPGATFCLGVNLQVGKTQLGAIYGYDFTDADWEFHAKPWVAFAIGFNFWSNDNGTSQGN